MVWSALSAMRIRRIQFRTNKKRCQEKGDVISYSLTRQAADIHGISFGMFSSQCTPAETSSFGRVFCRMLGGDYCKNMQDNYSLHNIPVLFFIFGGREMRKNCLHGACWGYG